LHLGILPEGLSAEEWIIVFSHFVVGCLGSGPSEAALLIESLPLSVWRDGLGWLARCLSLDSGVGILV